MLEDSMSDISRSTACKRKWWHRTCARAEFRSEVASLLWENAGHCRRRRIELSKASTANRCRLKAWMNKSSRWCWCLSMNSNHPTRSRAFCNSRLRCSTSALIWRPSGNLWSTFCSSMSKSPVLDSDSKLWRFLETNLKVDNFPCVLRWIDERFWLKERRLWEARSKQEFVRSEAYSNATG